MDRICFVQLRVLSARIPVPTTQSFQYLLAAELALARGSPLAALQSAQEAVHYENSFGLFIPPGLHHALKYAARLIRLSIYKI
jgi:hypothetical protein